MSVDFSPQHAGPICSKLKGVANVMLKFLSQNMANTLILFAEKMCVAFALQQKYVLMHLKIP